VPSTGIAFGQLLSNPVQIQVAFAPIPVSLQSVNVRDRFEALVSQNCLGFVDNAGSVTMGYMRARIK
jgi:hypothetical protein